jgi:cell division protein FtsB
MRLLIGLLVLAFAALQLKLWLSDSGLREVARLKAQVQMQTDENRQLAERNAALEAEVQDLKHGTSAVEERARSELGMVKPDETFFQITPYQSARRPE